MVHTSITYPNQPMLHSSWFDRTQKVVIRNQQKITRLHLLLGICFQSLPLSKHVYKKRSKGHRSDTPIKRLIPAAVNVFLSAHFELRGRECYSCLGVWQQFRCLDICVCLMSLSICPCGAVDYTLIAPPHTLRCMKVLVHPVATPEPLPAICLQSEPAVLMTFCFVKSLACAQGSLPQIQWANSVWKRHSF